MGTASVPAHEEFGQEGRQTKRQLGGPAVREVAKVSNAPVMAARNAIA